MKISILIVTYNHFNFIVECLDSILQQEANFSYEILIGEDASTDGTREICQKYSSKYPNKVRLFLGKRENVKILFDKPIGQNNFKNLLKHATGKYIAICEGDDYWTDPLKLQKQVDFLEANPTYAGCFHDVSTVDEKGTILKENYFKPKQSSYTQKECLIDLKSSYATCSVLFRSSVFAGEWPRWFQERSCDEFLDLMITRKGLLGYMRENMGAYRIHGGGIWQGANSIWRLKDKIFRYQLLFEEASFRNKYEEIVVDFLLSHIEEILLTPGISPTDKEHYTNLLTSLYNKPEIGVSRILNYRTKVKGFDRIKSRRKAEGQFLEKHFKLTERFLENQRINSDKTIFTFDGITELIEKDQFAIFDFIETLAEYTISIWIKPTYNATSFELFSSTSPPTPFRIGPFVLRDQGNFMRVIFASFDRENAKLTNQHNIENTLDWMELSFSHNRKTNEVKIAKNGQLIMSHFATNFSCKRNIAKLGNVIQQQYWKGSIGPISINGIANSLEKQILIANKEHLLTRFILNEGLK